MTPALKFSAARLAVRACLFALMLSMAGCTSAPVEAKRRLETDWLELRTAHFEFVSNASAARTQQIARELETFQSLLGTILGIGKIEVVLPVRVYVFGNANSFEAFEPTGKIAAYAISAEDRIHIAIDASRFEAASRIVRHELVHAALRNRSGFRYPAWYDEGLADFLSTVQVEDAAVSVGEPPSERAAQLIFGTQLGLERVLTARAIRNWKPRPLSMFYAQSWALTHFFTTSWQLGYRDRRKALLRYLSRLNEGADPRAAYEEAVGESVEDLQREFERYVQDGKFPRIGIALSEPNAKAGKTPDTRPLPLAEALCRLASLASAHGQTGFSDSLAGRALVLDPEHAHARARAAQAAAGRRDFGAFPALDALPPLETADAELQRLWGDALAARVRFDPSPTPQFIDAARARYRRSIELDPTQAAAHASLGRMLLFDREPTDDERAEGIAALEEARARLPASETVNLSLAQLELQRGQRSTATLLLEDVLAIAHGTEQTGRELQTLLRAASLEPLASGDDAYREPRLDVERPAPATLVQSPLALVEVAGRAGLGDLRAQDVIVVIDESGSTLFATGDDVDGDGVKGRSGQDAASLLSKPPKKITSDYDDSIIATELAATRELVAKLNPISTRAALVTFGTSPRIRASLGPPADVMKAIQSYDPGEDLNGSRVGAGLKQAMLEFAERRSPTPRRRVVIVMSDGDVTLFGAPPSPPEYASEALDTADLMGDVGITVHSLLVGRNDGPTGQVFRELARRTGGDFIEVRRPADAVDALVGSRLAGLESVSLRNLTLDAQGRAVRSFADGTFDGYVPLTEGANEIEIRAKLSGGHELREVRMLRYERPAEATPDTERQAQALVEAIQQRTTEIKIAEETRRARRAAREREAEVRGEVGARRERGRRALDVVVEPPTPSPASPR